MVGAGAGSGSLSPPSQSDQAQLRGRTTSLKRSLSDVIRKGTPNSPSHFSPLSATSHKRGFSEDLLKVDERSSNSLSPSRPSTSPPASSTRSPGLRLDINSFNKIFKNPKSASSGGAGAGGGGGGGGGERGDGGDTNDYHQQPASASLVMPPSSSLPLLSHSKMSSLPRSGHSSGNLGRRVR